MRRTKQIREGLRRWTAVLLVLAVTTMLAACGERAKDDGKAPEKEPTSTVTTAPTQTPEDGSGTETLTAGSNAAPEKKAMDEAMRQAYADFSYRLFKECAQGDDGNCVISPFSVYTALAMLANGAKGDTLTQMDTVLGLTAETRNQYLAGWIASLTGQENVAFTCSDSVWIAKRFRTAVPDPFLPSRWMPTGRFRSFRRTRRRARSLRRQTERKRRSRCFAARRTVASWKMTCSPAARSPTRAANTAS